MAFYGGGGGTRAKDMPSAGIQGTNFPQSKIFINQRLAKWMDNALPKAPKELASG